ncbi:hypothetical protein RRSWK_05814 [Rhodopirellula sp. SWK7]|nr:hypothetical protein RRSWK_05814 [Rhodopirellula sp. SWK7]
MILFWVVRIGKRCMGDSATESTEFMEGIGMQLLCALGVLGGLLLLELNG